jgi:photosystem II stability/assembly factor-like uncharacterized protein
VAVVGVSPVVAGLPFAGPPQLYISTDMVDWTNVTPPQSHVPTRAGYSGFDGASFISATTGWVTTWDPGTSGGLIYGTTNGGKTWRDVSVAGHGINAGDAFWLQLLTPSVAFGETVVANGPGESLAVTTNSGRTWHLVYRWPSPNPADDKSRGPFEMPTVFVSRDRGFGAPGAPPAEPQMAGEEDAFFVTSDGGATWAAQSPPLPSTAYKCPAGASGFFTPVVSCSFGVPTFSGPDHGVLPAVVTRGSGAAVAFDATSDAGRSWRLAAQRSVTVDPGSCKSGCAHWPLVSVASGSAWWVLGWTNTGLLAQVSANAGASWARVAAPTSTGVPVALNALDATHALLTMRSLSGSAVWLLATADGGRSWHRVVLE